MPDDPEPFTGEDGAELMGAIVEGAGAAETATGDRLLGKALQKLGSAVGDGANLSDLANKIGEEMDPSDPAATFMPLLRAADSLGLAYVHVIDMGLPDLDTLRMVRANWSGSIIANNMLKADSATELIEEGRADAVSFGRAFIANPDLPRRIREAAALAKPDYTLLYTGEERGYIDYPALPT